MGKIALVPVTPNKDGNRVVENITVAPGHVEHWVAGKITLKPSVWFAPEGYEAITIPEGEYCAVGDIYNEDGSFTRPIRLDEQI